MKKSKNVLIALALGVVTLFSGVTASILPDMVNKTHNTEQELENTDETVAATAPSNTSGYWTDSGRYSTNWSGSGTEADPYLISTAQQLAGLSYMVYSGTGPVTDSKYFYKNKYFKQTANIDLSAYYWQPIGAYEDREGNSVQYSFSGIYDGNGYIVSGIYTKTPPYSSLGLFGFVSSGTIKNVGVMDSYIEGCYQVGGVVGMARDSIITNCYNAGTVKGSDEDAGGVVGSVSSTTVTNCYNTGTVNGDMIVGGVIGYVGASSTIRNCYNMGVVNGGQEESGGVIGYANGASIIVSNCYNTGSVTGDGSGVGGVIGYASVSSATISNCYNTGSVSAGDDTAGGVIGWLYGSSTIAKCYYGGACTLNSGVNGASVTGSTTKIIVLNTTSYAKGKAWYTNSSNWDSNYPWDMDNVWHVDEYRNDGYPVIVPFRHTPINSSGYWTDSGRYSTSWSGLGTQENPYLITNAKELAGLSYMVYSGKGPETNSYSYYKGKYFRQTADIDLSAYYWQPIGIACDRSGGSTERDFAGIYDGGGHTVSGIFTPVGSGYAYSFQGLFGVIDGAEIMNVGVINSLIQGDSYIGAVAGIGDVKNCYNTGYVSGNSFVGGITGNGCIQNCFNTGFISGNSNVGGLLGADYLSSESRTIAQYCYNTGNITGNAKVGGIVGSLGSNLYVQNCYNTGYIKGGEYTGGIVGDGSARNCYNTGSVIGVRDYYGGVSGVGVLRNCFNTGNCFFGVIGCANDNRSVRNCYYGGPCTAEFGGLGPTGDVVKIAALNTTTYAKGTAWYTNSSNWNAAKPWDFSKVWEIDPNENDGYPILIYVDTWEDYAASSYAGGTGTQSNPFIIKTPEQLGKLVKDSRTSSLKGMYYKLGSNIDLSAHVWNGIGPEMSIRFEGNFDGDFYSINNINTSTDHYVPDFAGLFSLVGSATIQNVIMKGGSVTGGDIAVIAGNGYAKVSNCIVDGVNATSTSSAAGIIGATSGSIKNCIYKNGTITAGHDAGGIAGWTNNLVLENCAVINANITGANGQGLIAGSLHGTGSIKASYGVGRLGDSGTKMTVYGNNSAWSGWVYTQALNDGYPMPKTMVHLGSAMPSGQAVYDRLVEIANNTKQNYYNVGKIRPEDMGDDVSIKDEIITLKHTAESTGGNKWGNFFSKYDWGFKASTKYTMIVEVLTLVGNVNIHFSSPIDTNPSTNPSDVTLNAVLFSATRTGKFAITFETNAYANTARDYAFRSYIPYNKANNVHISFRVSVIEGEVSNVDNYTYIPYGTFTSEFV